MSALRIPTRPGLLARLHRLCIALRVRLLRWEAAGIRAEREQYEEIGAVGPVYLFNSINAQMRCLRAARLLELGL